jgi:DNA-binding NarL/FixJ family response regulator
VVRVILAEDSFIVREGLQEILAGEPGVDVVAACADLDGLLEAVSESDADVVVTDIRMPPSNLDEGIQAAATLRRTHPHLGVVVLSHYSEPAYLLALLEAGSDGRGYLLKERVHDSRQLVSAIETVAGGGSFIDPKTVEALVHDGTRAGRSLLAELTEREISVLAGIAEGKSNAAIAESLQVSTRAVEKHTHSIFAKLGLASAADVSKRVKAALMFLADRRPGTSASP